MKTLKKLFYLSVLSAVLLFTAVDSFAASEKTIIAKIAELGQIDNEAATQQFNLVFNAIKEELKAGNEVMIKKFGKFEVQARTEREGRNPKTGAAIKIPAKRYVNFKAADGLKDEMNIGVGKAEPIETKAPIEESADAKNPTTENDKLVSK